MRWWTAAGAAAMIGVVTVQPAAGQTTSLAGVIDFHVHSGPDSRPRSVGDLEIARIAKRAGMRGLVFKNHFTSGAACGIWYMLARIEVTLGIDVGISETFEDRLGRGPIPVMEIDLRTEHTRQAVVDHDVTRFVEH